MIPTAFVEAIQDVRVSPRALRVLIALWGHVGRSGGLTVRPRREILAQMTGLSVENVSRVTSELEAAGYVTKEGRGGFSKSTRYTLWRGPARMPKGVVSEGADEGENGVASDTHNGVTHDTRNGVTSDTVEGNNGVASDTHNGVTHDTRNGVTSDTVEGNNGVASDTHNGVTSDTGSRVTHDTRSRVTHDTGKEDTPSEVTPLEGRDLPLRARSLPPVASAVRSRTADAGRECTQSGPQLALVPSPSEQPDPEPDPKPPARRRRRSSDPAKSGPTWEAYAAAYQRRYRTAPVRNARTNAQLAQLVERVGADAAPEVAAYYLTVDRTAYSSRLHPVALLLQDCEGLHTAWRRGLRPTDTRSRQGDQTSALADAFEQVRRQRAAERAAANGRDPDHHHRGGPRDDRGS